MKHLPEQQQERALQQLMERESVLQARVSEEDLRYSGLKDLDGVLSLIAVKLEIANHLLSHFDPNSVNREAPPTIAQMVREKSILPRMSYCIFLDYAKLSGSMMEI